MSLPLHPSFSLLDFARSRKHPPGPVANSHAPGLFPGQGTVLAPILPKPITQTIGPCSLPFELATLEPETLDPIQGIAAPMGLPGRTSPIVGRLHNLTTAPRKGQQTHTTQENQTGPKHVQP